MDTTNYVEAVDCFAQVGMDFVLCNHYNALYTKPFGGAYEADEYPKRFVDEFYSAKRYGLTKGVKVFFGIEVAIVMPDCPYAEFLIYGATPEFLLAHPKMYDLSQDELFELTQKNGLMLVQAHPFRKEQGHFPHDCTKVDGVEINCHYRFLREENKVRELGAKYDLAVTCGSDFHKKGQEGTGGIICGDVSSEQELKDVLLSRNFQIFTR